MKLPGRNQTQMATPMTMDNSGKVVARCVSDSESLSEVV